MSNSSHPLSEIVRLYLNPYKAIFNYKYRTKKRFTAEIKDISNRGVILNYVAGIKSLFFLLPWDPSRNPPLNLNILDERDFQKQISAISKSGIGRKDDYEPFMLRGTNITVISANNYHLIKRQEPVYKFDDLEVPISLKYWDIKNLGDITNEELCGTPKPIQPIYQSTTIVAYALPAEIIEKIPEFEGQELSIRDIKAANFTIGYLGTDSQKIGNKVGFISKDLFEKYFKPTDLKREDIAKDAAAKADEKVHKTLVLLNKTLQEIKRNHNFEPVTVSDGNHTYRVTFGIKTMDNPHGVPLDTIARLGTEDFLIHNPKNKKLDKNPSAEQITILARLYNHLMDGKPVTGVFDDNSVYRVVASPKRKDPAPKL